MTPDIFSLIGTGDVEAIRSQLDSDGNLVHGRRPDPHFFYLTPLQFAAAQGQLAVCRLLVERGAEVYPNPMNSYPPVIHAAWNGHRDVVQYFLQEIPDRADGTNRLGVTIHLAARQGWLDIVRRHIEADPLAVHQRGWLGDTPLHWPAHEGYVEIVELLLDHGAVIDADETNCYGGKPLHWASEHSPRAAELLLRRGAAVNARNLKQDSDFAGMTPLIMNACQKDDCAEVTGILLQYGADQDAADAKGKTAFDYAEARGNHKIAAILRAHIR